MRLALPIAAPLLAAALAACSKRPEPAAQPAPPPPAGETSFRLRDLAAAIAVDARLARLSLVAGDVHQALAAGLPAKERAEGYARAKGLAPALEQAAAEAEAALAGVAHPVVERIESDFGARTRVAPRESGHELDPAAARLTGQMAARRAKATAAQLPSALRDPALRYADAEERALDAFTGLFQAPAAERPTLARAYHAAKADALSALAAYFAALAAR